MSTHELTGWSHALAAAAQAEGWDLFDADGSVNGPWQVQAFDEPLYDWQPGDTPLPDLGDEMVAWWLVKGQRTCAAIAALDFLAEHNPLEYVRIMAWPVIIEGEWDYDTDSVKWGPS